MVICPRARLLCGLRFASRNCNRARIAPPGTRFVAKQGETGLLPPRSRFSVATWRRANHFGVHTCLCLALVLEVAGCASGSSARDYEREPLPYHVGIFIDSQSLPAADGKTARVTYELTARQLANTIRKTLLGAEPVVSHVEVLQAQTRNEALAQSRGLDTLLAIGVETTSAYSDYSRSAAWGSLEIFAFFFGNFGAWFVPTVSYETPSRLVVEGVDLHQTRVRQWHAQGGGTDLPFDWSAEFESTAQSTSLWGRSRNPLHYLLTILAPPMLIVPGEEKQLSATLTHGVTNDLTHEIRSTVRERLIAREWVRPLSVVFLAPDPNTVVTGDSISLELGLANREGQPLRALELVRLSPPTKEYRWSASRESLQQLDEAIEMNANPSDFIYFTVEQSVPVTPGGNLIKVRVSRDDGEQVVRTMLYIR